MHVSIWVYPAFRSQGLAFQRNSFSQDINYLLVLIFLFIVLQL